MWALLFVGCNAEDTVVHSSISTVRTTVAFTGTPVLHRDNGDVFRLDNVAAILYSVRFLACSDGIAGYSLIPMNTADAGHSDIVIPTNWNRPTYIDVLSPDTVFTEIHFEPQSICLGAVTWARWDGGTYDLPLEELGTTFSMYMRGSCVDSEGFERFFDISTSVPSERIDSLAELEDDGTSDTLNFTLVVDTTELLHKIECSDDLLENSSSSALQALFNLQNNAHWTWEWE